MARVMYFDCFSGAAGDMVLGALHRRRAAGRDAARARSAASASGTSCASRASCAPASRATHVAGRRATDAAAARAHARHAHGHDHDARHARPRPRVRTHTAPLARRDRALIGHSALSAAGKARAIALFRRLAEAEAAIHDMPVDRGPPARSRRGRLHHRHRRRGLRARMVRHRRHRRVAAERRAAARWRSRTARFPVPAPGDAAAADGRPDLQQRTCRPSW